MTMLNNEYLERRVRFDIRGFEIFKLQRLLRKQPYESFYEIGLSAFTE